MTEFLSLLSVRRSGTTLLQRLLNLHPQVVMFGEHFGFLSEIAAGYHRLKAPRTLELLASGRPHLESLLAGRVIRTNPQGWSTEWTNALDPNEAAGTFRRLVTDLLYPQFARSELHRYWGFKELRYGPAELLFLNDLFPRGRFLLLFREPMSTFLSQCRLGWYAGRRPDEASALFHNEYQRLIAVWQTAERTEALAGRVLPIVYEKLASDPVNQCSVICRWLGIAPIDTAKIAAVAESSGRRSDPGRTGKNDPFRASYANGPAREDEACYERVVSTAALPPLVPSD